MRFFRWNLSKKNFPSKATVNKKKKNQLDGITNQHTSLLSVIHSFDKFCGSNELHPPILLLSRQSLLVKTVDVLNRGQHPRRIGFDEDEDEHRHEVISSRNRFLIRHAQQIHDGGGRSQHATKLILRSLNANGANRTTSVPLTNLVGADHVDLALCSRPGALSVIDLWNAQVLVRRPNQLTQFLDVFVEDSEADNEATTRNPLTTH